MHVHIIGICGTFMGGVALLARGLGHTVSGSDANVYPPMSTQLAEQGVELMQGYAAENLKSKPDLVIIGNALSRGNVEVEAVLNIGLRYTSGAQWLSEHLLQDRWVLAVAGTHGKTTTASMLAWILEDCGLQPGFLIGGVPQNFGVSARLGATPFFVVEADEYDTAFFDKRAKFVHYRPRTAILNNLEFDHADIYSSLAAIETQFHHLLRTVPGNGKLVVNAMEPALQRVLALGCWSELEYFVDNKGWSAKPLHKDCSRFDVMFAGDKQGVVSWDMVGKHNMHNALAAIAAARHAGVAPAGAIDALARFRNTRRRLELLGAPGGISVYDDFAHHPTAIRLTLDGLRARVGNARIVAVLDIRSNSMKMGVHKEGLASSLVAADRSIVLQPQGLSWDLVSVLGDLGASNTISQSVDEILDLLIGELRAGDHVLIMSNGGFGGLHKRLLDMLENRQGDY